MSNRFFHATVLGERLHVNGVPEWGLWDPMRFDLGSEEDLDILSTTRDHKTRTREELEAIVKAAGRDANENGVDS